MEDIKASIACLYDNTFRQSLDYWLVSMFYGISNLLVRIGIVVMDDILGTVVAFVLIYHVAVNSIE